MLLASYTGTRPGVQGIANRVIRWRLNGDYSHNEVVFEPHDGVGHLFPDGSCAQGLDGSLWCGSSVAAERIPAHSPRRPGHLGGVRRKRIVLDSRRWDLVRIDRDPVLAAQWFLDHEGELYDWQLIAGYVAWLLPHKAQRWACGEACFASFGAPEGDAHRFDPCTARAAALLMQ